MNFLSLYGPLVVAPVLFLLTAAVVFALHRRKASAVGVGVFLIQLLVGWWAITRSRSSTAGIGFLFLPSFAAIGGMFAIGFASWRSSSSVLIRIVSYICAILVCAGIGAEIQSGVASIQSNHQRDEAYQSKR